MMSLLSPSLHESTGGSVRTESAQLPWSGAPVRVIRDLTGYFGTRLGESAARYLPRTIALFVTPDISGPVIDAFLEGATSQLRKELAARKTRCAAFVDACNISSD